MARLIPRAATARAVLIATFLLCTGLLTGAHARAASVVIEGPATRVQLLELYTSEGCSSCPPADAWLARLAQDRTLWQRVVPVALHVDYWDGLGWRDRFASPSHGARQRAYERAGHANGTYTPGWFVDGREWRGWFARQPLPEAAGGEVGSLRLTMDGARVEVATAHPALARRGAVLHVALLGSGLASEVRRGENRGRALSHAFVVLQHVQVPFGAGRGSARLPSWQREPVPRRAIAAWITAAGDPTPLQAVGGWLPAAP
jgi:hypothetical protein